MSSFFTAYSVEGRYVGSAWTAGHSPPGPALLLSGGTGPVPAAVQLRSQSTYFSGYCGRSREFLRLWYIYLTIIARRASCVF